MAVKAKEGKIKKSISNKSKIKHCTSTSKFTVIQSTKPKTSHLKSKKVPIDSDLEDIKPISHQEPLHTLEIQKVEEAVNVLIKVEDNCPAKKSLLLEENDTVLLQIISIKVPKTPERQIRCVLPHPLLTDTSDVCLFVSDLQKGKRVDHEPTVQHYKDLLRENAITDITEVISLRQIKVEYDQYELRRRLCCKFDFFLSDARVNGHIRHLLGREFVRKRKLPTPVNLQKKDLKNEIDKALSKTVLSVHAKGDSFIMAVGRTNQSPEHVANNIVAVAEQLAKNFPGGWDNIRSLYIKSEKSLAIPIYITLKSPNLVHTPYVKPKRPKAAVPVEGDLSTLLGASVVVHPSGEVEVRRDRKHELDEISWSDLDMSEEDFEEDDGFKQTKQMKKKKTTSKVKDSKMATDSGDIDDDENADNDEEEEEEEEEEGEEDSVVDAAEDAYLSQWQEEFIDKVAKKQSAEDVPNSKKVKQKLSTQEHKSKKKRDKKTKLSKLSTQETKGEKKKLSTQETKTKGETRHDKKQKLSTQESKSEKKGNKKNKLSRQATVDNERQEKNQKLSKIKQKKVKVKSSIGNKTKINT